MKGEIGLRRRIPAGILDAGFASLATFVVGLAAVTQLDDVSRGVYAVFFTAFVGAALLATELVFTPSQVKAVSFPTAERLSLVGPTLRLGLGPTLSATVAVAGAVAVTQSYSDAATLIPLTLTAATAIVLSPMQDHVRRMLHIAALNWRAAGVSVVQFLVAAAAVGAGILLDVPTPWIPFGALTLANAVSLTVAILVAHASVRERASAALSFRELATSGRWFVLAAVAPSLAAFAVVAIIGLVVSPEELGYAESARVVSQPIMVLAAGISAVLAPRSMRAAMDGDRSTARRTGHLYLTFMAFGGLAYGLLVAWDVTINPMAHLVPSAYVLPGLVALTVLANVVASAPFLKSNELAGAHQERSLARIAWLSSGVWVLGGLTAWLTGAYARAIGMLTGGAVRYGAQTLALRPIYVAGTENRLPGVAESGDATDPETDATGTVEI